jgi:hypothetical protein
MSYGLLAQRQALIAPARDVLNLFYEERDPDRWFRYDRYPRWLPATAAGQHRWPCPIETR